MSVVAWLDQYVNFMYLMGATLVPAGGVLVSRFLLSKEPVVVANLYTGAPAWSWPGLAAWLLGSVTWFLLPGAGTLASLAVSILAHRILDTIRLTRRTHNV